jgi:hypothetical protein
MYFLDIVGSKSGTAVKVPCNLYEVKGMCKVSQDLMGILSNMRRQCESKAMWMLLGTIALTLSRNCWLETELQDQNHLPYMEIQCKSLETFAPGLKIVSEIYWMLTELPVAFWQ